MLGRCAIIVSEVERVRKATRNRVVSSHEQALPETFQKKLKKTVDKIGRSDIIKV